VRYAWIDQQVGHYPLSSLCSVLSVSVNGYRAWKGGGTAQRSRLTDTQLLTRHVASEEAGDEDLSTSTEQALDKRERLLCWRISGARRKRYRCDLVGFYCVAQS
jgi:putative transposase